MNDVNKISNKSEVFRTIKLFLVSILTGFIVFYVWCIKNSYPIFKETSSIYTFIWQLAYTLFTIFLFSFSLVFIILIGIAWGEENEKSELMKNVKEWYEYFYPVGKVEGIIYSALFVSIYIYLIFCFLLP